MPGHRRREMSPGEINNTDALRELESARVSLQCAYDSSSPRARENIAGVKGHLDEIIALHKQLIWGSKRESERLKAWQAGKPKSGKRR